MTKLIRGQFSIEMQKPFRGYYDPQRKWNGWDCPMFEWEEAIGIVKWINKWNGRDILRTDSDRQVIIELEKRDEPFEIEGQTTGTEDGEKILFPIGTGWWVWELQT